MKKMMICALVCIASLCNGETMNEYYEVARASCHDIGSLRVEMNRINNQILELLAERTAYVKRAGDLKAHTIKIAEDRKRVAEQEALIVAKSEELGVPVEVSIPAFRAIVEESIKYQQKYLDELQK